MATIRPAPSVRPQRGPVAFEDPGDLSGTGGERQAQLLAAEARRTSNAASVASQAGTLVESLSKRLGGAGEDFLVGAGEIDDLRVELGAASRRIDEREDAIMTSIIERDFRIEGNRLFQAAKAGGFATQGRIADFKAALSQHLGLVLNGDGGKNPGEASKLLLAKSKVALNKSLQTIVADLNKQAAEAGNKEQIEIMDMAMNTTRRRLNAMVSSAPHHFKDIFRSWQKAVSGDPNDPEDQGRYAPTANPHQTAVMLNSGMKAFANTAIERYRAAQDFDSVRRVLRDPEVVAVFSTDEMREKEIQLSIDTKDFGSERARLIKEQEALSRAIAEQAAASAKDTQAELEDDAKRAAATAAVTHRENVLAVERKTFEFEETQRVSETELAASQAELKKGQDLLEIAKGRFNADKDNADAKNALTKAEQDLRGRELDFQEKKARYDAQVEFTKRDQELQRLALDLQKRENALSTAQDKLKASTEIAKLQAQLAEGRAKLREDRLKFAEKNFKPEQKAELARLTQEANEARVAAEAAKNEAIRIQNQNTLTNELQDGKNALRERELKVGEERLAHGNAVLAFERRTAGVELDDKTRAEKIRLEKLDAEIREREIKNERTRVELERKGAKLDKSLSDTAPPFSSKSSRTDFVNFTTTNLERFKVAIALDHAVRTPDQQGLVVAFVEAVNQMRQIDPITKTKSDVSVVIRDAFANVGIDVNKLSTLDPRSRQVIFGGAGGPDLGNAANLVEREIGSGGFPSTNNVAPKPPATVNQAQAQLPAAAARLASLQPVGIGGIYNSVNILTGPGPSAAAGVAGLAIIGDLVPFGQRVIDARTKFEAFKGALVDAFVRTQREGQPERESVLNTVLKRVDTGFLDNDDALATALGALDQFLEVEFQNLDIAVQNFDAAGTEGGGSPSPLERGKISNRMIAIQHARRYIGAPPYANGLGFTAETLTADTALMVGALLRYERLHGVQLEAFDPDTGTGGRMILDGQLVDLSPRLIKMVRDAAASGN